MPDERLCPTCYREPCICSCSRKQIQAATDDVWHWRIVEGGRATFGRSTSRRLVDRIAKRVVADRKAALVQATGQNGDYKALYARPDGRRFTVSVWRGDELEL